MFKDEIYFILFTVLSSASFSILFKVPPRFFIHATLVGTVGAFFVRCSPEHIPIGYTVFATSFTVGALSHLFAKRTGQPAQIFLIPGVIFLVPGTIIYRAMRMGLSEEYDLMFKLMLSVGAIGFGISFGLLLANWVVPSRQEL